MMVLVWTVSRWSTHKFIATQYLHSNKPVHLMQVVDRELGMAPTPKEEAMWKYLHQFPTTYQTRLARDLDQ